MADAKDRAVRSKRKEIAQGFLFRLSFTIEFFHFCIEKSCTHLNDANYLARLLFIIGVKRQKREPQKPLKTKNTILVHRKSDFKSQLEKCQKLLDSG